MRLENLVLDARDPRATGRFWEAVVGGRTLTDEAQVFETRLELGAAAFLDLCICRVDEPSQDGGRLHPDLRGGAQQQDEVARLVALGAVPVDIGQGDVPWVVLADPEGNPCCVMEHRVEYVDTGPIAALPLDSADPERDADFWSWLTGWRPVDALVDAALRHPAGVGPLLELCRETTPKAPGSKNRWHLDVRLGDADDRDDVLAGIVERRGTLVDHDWGELPWTVCTDPSGNELCVLPFRG